MQRNQSKMPAMAQVAEEAHIDIESREARKKLALMVTRLFELWNITTADQLELLGLSRTSRAQIAKYRNGGAVPSSRSVW